MTMITEVPQRPRPSLLLAGMLLVQLFGPVLPCFATEVGPLRLGSASGQPSLSGGGNSSAPLFSRDGRSILFLSEAHNLVTNDDHTLNLNLFIRDFVSGSTVLVS